MQRFSISPSLSIPVTGAIALGLVPSLRGLCPPYLVYLRSPLLKDFRVVGQFRQD